MEYITVPEAAAHWGVSERQVQRLLSRGRITGAIKHGNAWMIPADAAKPQDLRRQKEGTGRVAFVFYGAVPLPKNAQDLTLQSLSEPYRTLALADLQYRRGDPGPAKQVWYLTGPHDATKLTAASLAAAAAISSGDYQLYDSIQAFLREQTEKALDPRQKALLSLPETMAAVSMTAAYLTPQWLKDCDFSLFPTELSPFLLYLHLMYLRNCGELEKLRSMGRAAILLYRQDTTFTWLDIQYRILTAVACYTLGRIPEAKALLCEALELAIPWGIILPFADYLAALGGLPEQILREKYPDFLEPITLAWTGSFPNWIKFHNTYTKEHITTVLTAREYQVAYLLSRGATYAEAAARMNLSVSRVKDLASVIYSKLYITKKRELKQYIL